MVNHYTLTGMYPELARLRFGSLVHALLTDPAPEAERWRQRLDRVVSEAAERGWLTIEALGRLRAADDAVVLSILDELAIARWFEDAEYHLTFNPPGASGRVGELLLEGSLGTFWLEVKTLLPAGASIVAQTTRALVQSIAMTIPTAAVLSLEIAHHPEGGISRRELRRYLETAADQLLAGASPPPAYTHSSGLYLRALDCLADSGSSWLAVDFVEEPWPGEIELQQRFWHDRLWRALRGGYSQLPHDGPPTLIMVVDHSMPPPNVAAWMSPLSELLRMGSHRHLSAVGRLLRDDLWNATPNLTFFLNPRARAAFPEQSITAVPEQRICILPFGDLDPP